jgi:hypothetical protein
MTLRVVPFLRGLAWQWNVETCRVFPILGYPRHDLDLFHHHLIFLYLRREVHLIIVNLKLLQYVRIIPSTISI